MVKNKDLPDSAAPPVWSFSLSLSLSLFLSPLPHRLGPIKAGLTYLLSPMPFILRVPPGSCWGWTPAPFPLWPLQIYCALWTFQIPMQYCSLQHWTLLSSSDTFTTGWFFFFFPLWLSLFIPSNYSWGSQDKNAEVVCHSHLQWDAFCQNLPPWPIFLGWLCGAWLTVSLS